MSLHVFLNDYRSIIIGFFVFAVFHSVAAQEKFKDFLQRFFGAFFVEYFWRLIYCLLSWMIYYPGYAYLFATESPLPASYYPFYDFSLPLRTLIDIIHVVGLIVTYWAFLQFDYLSFLGIRQFWNGIKILRGKPVPTISVAGVNRLEIKGIYQYLRHPMLAGAFLMAIPHYLSVASLVTFALIVTYVIIGGYFEEGRLIKNFGDQYLRYKKDVGAYFPKVSTRL